MKDIKENGFLELSDEEIEKVTGGANEDGEMNSRPQYPKPCTFYHNGCEF